MRVLSDALVVMLDGRIVESGKSAAIVASPQHQHTRRLLSATPTHSVASDDRLPHTAQHVVAVVPDQTIMREDKSD
jgi:ABC-type dipeptide/oligopeptide/nickel transport system ATPase component